MSGVIYPINNKKYTAEDVEIFNSTRTSGVYTVLDFDCSLSGNVVTVGKGLAWIKNGDFTGKALAFKEPETLTLDGADATNDRYDVVAIRYDASKTEPELVVIKGEAEAGPVIPRRRKETYLYELFLYAILRKAGEGSASVENLIDLRTNETYCGLMRDSVTSAVAPAYETIFDVVEFGAASLYSGATLDFDYEKYQYLIADVGNTIASCGIVLPLQTGSGTNFAFSGSNFCVKQQQIGEPVTMYFRMQVDLTEFSDRGHVITLLEWSSTPDFSSKQNARLDRLVGVTKQPEGYVKVDDIYNPESHNAQSGEAVKQAIDEALKNFEGGGDIEIPESGGDRLTEEQITALDNMFRISAFTENPANAYNSFKEAFGIGDDINTEDTTITLSANTLTFNSEESQTLTATVTPINVTDEVVWKSSNNAIATVENGVVTPVSDGTCVISASVRNVSAKCDVIVSIENEVITYKVNNYLTNVTNSNSATSVNAGQSYTATLTANEGYAIDENSIVISMNATEITDSVYNAETNEISIATVIGDISITASAIVSISDWDFEWDYTQGLMTENGFTKYKYDGEKGNPFTEELRDDGVYLAPGGFNTMFLSPTDYETMDSGVMEITFNLQNGDNYNTRFKMSNGKTGCIMSMSNTQWKFAGEWAANKPYLTDYTIRIEFNKNGTNYLYADATSDSVTKASTVAETTTKTGIDLFHDASIIIKSFKIKASV